jgi:hypothetical protein
LKFFKLQNHLQVLMILAMLTLLCGCGSDGGTTPNLAVSKAASVSITATGDGVYVIQGYKMDGIAGMQLNITYDSSCFSSPTVTQGEYISEELMVANTLVPGSIKFAIIGVKPLSGSGQIASISFATHTEPSNITIDIVNMVDANNDPVQ